MYDHTRFIVILSNAWLIPQLCLCYPPYLLWHSPMFCDHRSLFLCVWSHHEWGCPWAKTLHGQKFLYHCLLHMLAWCSFFICLAMMTQIIKITAKVIFTNSFIKHGTNLHLRLENHGENLRYHVLVLALPSHVVILSQSWAKIKL